MKSFHNDCKSTEMATIQAVNPKHKLEKDAQVTNTVTSYPLTSDTGQTTKVPLDTIKFASAPAVCFSAPDAR